MSGNCVYSVRKVVKIMEKDAGFETEILTKNDDLVGKVLLDKIAGWMVCIH